MGWERSAERDLLGVRHRPQWQLGGLGVLHRACSHRTAGAADRSYYVPLNPARLLDTRTGVGGNISALSSQALTELKVAGFGGVPPTGATAVVLNVTVDAPLTNGFIRLGHPANHSRSSRTSTSSLGRPSRTW